MAFVRNNSSKWLLVALEHRSSVQQPFTLLTECPVTTLTPPNTGAVSFTPFCNQSSVVSTTTRFKPLIIMFSIQPLRATHKEAGNSDADIAGASKLQGSAEGPSSEKGLAEMFEEAAETTLPVKKTHYLGIRKSSSGKFGVEIRNGKKIWPGTYMVLFNFLLLDLWYVLLLPCLFINSCSVVGWWGSYDPKNDTLHI